MNKNIAGRRVLGFCVLPLALWLGGCAGYMQQPTAAMLDGAHEVPVVTSMASGRAEITVGSDHRVSGSINVSAMTPTMAHVHFGEPGKNGPVVIPLTKASASLFVVPEGSKLNDSQYESYLAGNLYVNVHSAAHPGGEIRAQLVPAKHTW